MLQITYVIVEERFIAPEPCENLQTLRRRKTSY